MFFFQDIDQHLYNNLFETKNSCDIDQINSDQWPFLISSILSEKKGLISKRPQLFICPTALIAEEVSDELRSYGLNTLFFPDFDYNPYSSVMASEHDLIKRHNVLQLFHAPDQNPIVVTTIQGAFLLQPKLEVFKKLTFTLNKEDIYAPHELSLSLVCSGYKRAAVADTPGTFCQRGEIFDIFPIALTNPVRLFYFDELIEKIHPINKENNRTIREDELNSIAIYPSYQIILSEERRNCLRSKLPMPSPGQKTLFEERKQIFSHLKNNQLFNNFPLFYSMFFEEVTDLFTIVKEGQGAIYILDYANCIQNYRVFYNKIESDFRDMMENDPQKIVPSPNDLYTNSEYFLELLNDGPICTVGLSTTPSAKQQKHSLRLGRTEYIKSYAQEILLKEKKNANDKENIIKQLTSLIKEQLTEQNEKVFCTYQSETSKKEIINLLEIHEVNFNHVTFTKGSLRSGFRIQDRCWIYSDSDFFSHKKIKAKAKGTTKKNIDLFAEQLATIQPGDFVIHKEHGVGIYRGLERLSMGASDTDFLLIEYESNDKIYLPVYKLDQISKHSSERSNVKPDRLRNDNFKKVKEKAKTSAKKLAFNLIELQAKRETEKAFAFSPPDLMFREFEMSFAFEETIDQAAAIHSVIEAMQKDSPMDYLVCGDVGFGKTEVAIRAAFKAVQDGKQVAVLVPTTILALQHYNTFSSRFNGFPITVDFLSRFKSPKEEKLIKEKVKDGKIDVIIGTHKLLSNTIEYKDLGLVVVDEEQRFGVTHKEKMKLLKSSVDFLTLTATPIPRTLQMAFLGIRDLSLIQTAPPKRQSITTYVIGHDDQTIRDAIVNEISRGGQVFYLYNRVQDIETVHFHLKQLVPELKVIVAHGQLPERELEKRMNDFYHQKGNLLLCTTIIESGIDIPTANTLIVHDAHKYGLSQLHQVRGRIGRSDRKAYAYFSVPTNKTLSNNSEARLKALQMYAEIGSGFSIASSDLEIRGAGEILGAEQSGHLETIGLELYTKLIEEAISEIKGTAKPYANNIEINTEFPAFIPESYIETGSERLKYYKLLSNCTDNLRLKELEDEIFDVFGPLAKETVNLLQIIEARNILAKLAVIKVQQVGKLITLYFDRLLLSSNDELLNKTVGFFMKKPNMYRFTPDYRVIVTLKETISPTVLLNLSKEIAEHL